MNMSFDSNLLSLPDLVLHHVCSFISCPFDLINFGNTCTRLHDISSSQSIWWHLSMNWLAGLWPWVENPPSYHHPRQWLFEWLSHIKMPLRNTKLQCDFGTGEVWNRIDSQRFRCMLGMLEIAYADRQKERHPGVLYERWLFDIGMYHRIEPNINYSSEDFQFSRQNILQLSSLGQAAERDLRARKQPYIDPMYYVKKISVSHDNWANELFPSGPHGSICPLLICPFQEAFTTEVSGISGLLMCLSLVLEKNFTFTSKASAFSLSEIASIINLASKSFCDYMAQNLPLMKQMWGTYCFTSALKSMATEDTFDLSTWQTSLNSLRIPLSSKNIIRGMSELVEEHGGIDQVVDNVRLRWRGWLIEEINTALFEENSSKKKVTRVNLTDSDLIGGDNMRQEMSAAAFISDTGVLVTWHLIGRLRY